MTILTNAGLEAVARLINGATAGAAFTYVALGSGSTAEAATQTALVTELTTNGAARAAATCTYEATGISKWVITFNFTGSVTVRELAVLNASSAGTMLLRHLLTADKTYSSGESVEVTITNTLSRV